MTTNDIGKRIAERRMDLGLSQTQLAERCGYSDKTAISKIENGVSQLNQKKIVIFADALQTTPAYLMGWVEDPNLTKAEVYAMEQAQRVRSYANRITLMVNKSVYDKSPLPEELLVAEAYSKSPQHIKEAIKALLQIKENDDASL